MVLDVRDYSQNPAGQWIRVVPIIDDLIAAAPVSAFQVEYKPKLVPVPSAVLSFIDSPKRGGGTIIQFEYSFTLAFGCCSPPSGGSLTFAEPDTRDDLVPESSTFFFIRVDTITPLSRDVLKPEKRGNGHGQGILTSLAKVRSDLSGDWMEITTLRAELGLLGGQITLFERKDHPIDQVTGPFVVDD
jgi:hypothetical protein